MRSYRNKLNILAEKYELETMKTKSPPTIKGLQTLHERIKVWIPEGAEHDEDRAALEAARVEFESAEKPQDDETEAQVEHPDEEPELQPENGKFRMNGLAFLLTFNDAGFTVETWDAFDKHMQSFITEHKVYRWTYSMEESLNSDDEGRIHFHAFLQWLGPIDWKDGKKVVKWIISEGKEVNPNIRPNYLALADNLDPGVKSGAARGPDVQQSLATAHFYLAMRKVGKLRHRSNVEAFKDYWPAIRRVDGFRLSGKLDDEAWLYYRSLFTVNFARAFDDVAKKRRYEEELKVSKMRRESEEIEQRLRSSAAYITFPGSDLVQLWKENFAHYHMRFPILVLFGPSRASKTEYAKSLFSNPLLLQVGHSMFLPDGMRSYDRDRHDCIIYDDVRNADFIRKHQEVFQSKSTIVELGRSPTGQSSFNVLLYRTPQIFTLNFSTEHLEVFHDDDFCSNPGNVYFMKYPPRNFTMFPPFSYPAKKEDGTDVKDWDAFDAKISEIHARAEHADARNEGKDYGWMAGWPEDGEMDEMDRNRDHDMDQDMDAQGPCFDHDLEYQVKGAFRVIELPWKSCPEPHLVEELP